MLSYCGPFIINDKATSVLDFQINDQTNGEEKKKRTETKKQNIKITNKKP